MPFTNIQKNKLLKYQEWLKIAIGLACEYRYFPLFSNALQINYFVKLKDVYNDEQYYVIGFKTACKNI